MAAVAAAANSAWSSFGFLKIDEPWRVLVEEQPRVCDPEWESNAAAVLETLVQDKWLLPPNMSPAPVAPSSSATPATSSTQSRPAVEASRDHHGGQAHTDPGLINEILHRHRWTVLQNVEARRLVAALIAPAWRRGAIKYASSEDFQISLSRFAKEALAKLSEVDANGRIIPEDESRNVVGEAMSAVRHNVRLEDLVLCLEAFERLPLSYQDSQTDWIFRCIVTVIEAIVNQASDDERVAWRREMQARINNEGGELYGQIDVRAWPKILQLVGSDCSILDPEACTNQICIQLTMSSEPKDRAKGLEHASFLINALRLHGKHEMTQCLREEEGVKTYPIREMFNDKDSFHRDVRFKFLRNLLRDAPRSYRRDVLHSIDKEDTDLSERSDDEIQLVMDLIKDLGANVRWCDNAYFQMIKEWLIGKHRGRGSKDGVVTTQQLSPEQICDHLEQTSNYPEFLKFAVKECLKLGRQFEAARMLARPMSKETSIFESNRNDRQLAYLIGLYSDLEEKQDRFGPMEECCLMLPHNLGDISTMTTEDLAKKMMIVEDGELMKKLEQDTVSHKEPMTMGIWWFWRCFNNSLDQEARASFVAMSFNGTHVIVDFERIESLSKVDERKGKELVRRILRAPHILKVTHDIDKTALEILQRALLTEEDLESDDVNMQYIAPLIDLTIPVSRIKHMRPRAPAVSKLSRLATDYLKLELCLTESLSNFERRPLRLSQMHYALTLSWCPLMILRALTTHRVLETPVLVDALLQVGLTYGPNADPWDRRMQQTLMCGDRFEAPQDVCAATDPHSGESEQENWIYGDNPWRDSTWVDKIKEQALVYDHFCVRNALPETVRLDPGLVRQATEAIETLENGTMEDMDEMYRVWKDNRESGDVVQE